MTQNVNCNDTSKVPLLVMYVGLISEKLKFLAIWFIYINKNSELKIDI